MVDHIMPLRLWAQPLWNPERVLGLENGQRGITCLGYTRQNQRCCKPISASQLTTVSLMCGFFSRLDLGPVRVRTELHKVLPSLLCHLHGTQKEQISVAWNSVLDKIRKTIPAYQLDQDQSTDSSRLSTQPFAASQQHGPLQAPSSPGERLGKSLFLTNSSWPLRRSWLLNINKKSHRLTEPSFRHIGERRMPNSGFVWQRKNWNVFNNKTAC
ncbi:hypothetical protein F5Y16DRAFT_375484 [Xylariaceae sp. FL0255]|nr:hypothetical protein F5Y16DRAFT_375484 [Xylariaceae sp. FL0255]